MPDSGIQGGASARALYLEGALTDQANGFDLRSARNYRWVFWLRFMAIGSGFLATVLQGLDLANVQFAASTVKNLALLFTTFATAVTAFESFFNPRDLWVRYTSTSGRLKALRAEVRYRRFSGDLDPTQVDRMFDDMQAVLAEANADWAKVRDTARAATTSPKPSG